MSYFLYASRICCWVALELISNAASIYRCEWDGDLGQTVRVYNSLQMLPDVSMLQQLETQEQLTSHGPAVGGYSSLDFKVVSGQRNRSECRIQVKSVCWNDWSEGVALGQATSCIVSATICGCLTRVASPATKEYAEVHCTVQ